MNPFHAECFKTVLKNKKILLGVTGSIAAFKAQDIVRFLKECGAEVRVVLTESAEKFVTPLTLETLSGERVLTSLWEQDSKTGLMGTNHIATARWADLVVIAPATANTIAKIAQGMADDLLSTEVLAFQGPLVIAPAMNPQMYGARVTQENIARLRERGVRFLGPTAGDTACGEVGEGRMLEPAQVVEGIAEAFFKKPNGKKALVTLGATRSFLDPVRFLTNRSSGQMGAAVCFALLTEGYEVTAVAGTRDIPLFSRLRVIEAPSARAMAQAAFEHWPPAELFVGAAAVLDWDFAGTASEKLKKEQGVPELRFQKNTDILSEIGRQKRPGQFVLGFAAETENWVDQAKSKLLKKSCDAVFVNDVSQKDRGFEALTNAGWWVDSKGAEALPLFSKPELARTLVQRIQQGVNDVKTRTSHLSIH